MGYDIEMTTKESEAKRYTDASSANGIARAAMHWIKDGPFAYDLEGAPASDGNGFVVRCKRCGMFAAA